MARKGDFKYEDYKYDMSQFRPNPGSRATIADQKRDYMLAKGYDIDDANNFAEENKGDAFRTSQPQDIQYQSAFDPATMTLNLDYNQQGLDKFRKEALRSGPSAWANRMGAQQQLEALNARESATRQAGGQNALAMSTLASRGGLSSGARERITREGAKNALMMSQDIGRQSRQNALQIGVNDEQNRISQLGQIPGMEVQRSALIGERDKYNINNKLEEAKRRNEFEIAKYKEQMAGYGAGQTAAAQAESGK